MSDPIRQEITVSTDPARVYATLTDSARFSAMSGGAPAEIGQGAGGAFSCFGGMIEGRHIELVAGERIVQAWRAKPWPAGHYSLVRFDLAAAPGGGTRITLTHSSFPEGQAEHLAAGWHENYWKPLARAVE